MQECPRKRYWSTEVNGIGITPMQNSIALSKGLAIHRGIESINIALMEGIDPAVGVKLDIEACVKAALAEFDLKAAKEELEVEEGESTTENYLYHEQKALVEFAVRGYALTRLPYHRSTYRPISVEQEKVLQLADDLILMGRSDADLQRLDNGGYYIFNFKTSFDWNDDIEQEAKIDIQGLSELILFEALTGNRVDGIHSEYFINGSRRLDKKDRVRKQDTFSIRPWMKKGMPGDTIQFAWKYYFEDRFGNNHSLGKTFTRVNIWEIMPIKEWVELLASGKVQSDQGDPMQKLFIAPTPYYRQPDDISSWITEVIAQELRVKEGMEAINNCDTAEGKQELLDTYFPRYRHACYSKYRKWCPFFSLCWGDKWMAQDPISSGLFKERTPHHDIEALSLGGE
jgi:hypothetical protein